MHRSKTASSILHNPGTLSQTARHSIESDVIVTNGADEGIEVWTRHTEASKITSSGIYFSGSEVTLVASCSFPGVHGVGFGSFPDRSLRFIISHDFQKHVSSGSLTRNGRSFRNLSGPSGTIPFLDLFAAERSWGCSMGDPPSRVQCRVQVI